MNKREPIFKPTTDDWYGNYEVDTCKLKYLGKLSDGKFRVAVWGNDDFGIEKDFDTESEAIDMFDKLAKYEVINHQDLYDLGFVVF
jgi:hypothetical protein